MRTWGRAYGVIGSSGGIGIVSSEGIPIIPSGTPPGGQPATGVPTSVWEEVTTDANGNNDLVYLTTLCQCLQLNLGEDPRFSNYGIPALQSAQTGVPPDFYAARMQSAFAQYFASLTITRVSANNSRDAEYQVTVMTNQGVILNANVPIPY